MFDIIEIVLDILTAEIFIDHPFWTIGIILFIIVIILIVCL